MQTHSLPVREISRIALRISATAKRILSELPDSSARETEDLRHPTLSRPQRLRRLIRGGYSYQGAPLSFVASVYHVFSALSIGFGVFLKGGEDFPANVLTNIGIWGIIEP